MFLREWECDNEEGEFSAEKQEQKEKAQRNKLIEEEFRKRRPVVSIYWGALNKKLLIKSACPLVFIDTLLCMMYTPVW